MDVSDVGVELPEEPPADAAGSNNHYFPNQHVNHLVADGHSEHKGQSQGWVVGVLMPCMQNILGIIVFVRMAWITGQAGVGGALLILALCKSTTILTALSMSAIATNGKISAGGGYYLLARSLGPAFGGSIGILYYFGLTSAAAMYILGAVEIFVEATDFEALSTDADIRILGIFILVLLFSVCVVGMKYVSRFGLILLSALGVSIACIYIGIFSAGSRAGDLPSDVSGISLDNLKDNFASEFEDDTDFHLVFAIFYPAVTGIMAGSNRSGYLKNPSKDIPKGTLLAILIVMAMYASLICLFGSVSERGELLDNKYLVATVAWPIPTIVTIGILFSTVGAALQSLASAPQVLSSIANDKVLPLQPFTDQQQALKLSAVMIGLIVLIGSLDAVAPIITMFFLLFYGFINIACCLLSILNNPSWRPKWPYYHWLTALGGSVLCFSIMIYINWWAACVSFFLAGVLYYYIDMKTQATNWGDGITGLRQERAKKALLGVHPEKVEHVKNWKPQILVLDVLTDQGTAKNQGLLAFVEQLKKGNGLIIFGTCIAGEESRENFQAVKAARNKLFEHFKHLRMEVFTKVVLSKTIEEGMKNLIQNSGLGGLEPNTIMLSWPENWATQEVRAKRFCRLVDFAEKAGLAILIVKRPSDFEDIKTHRRHIDIWWFCYDGGLMCLIAYLLKKHKTWRRCSVRIFYVVVKLDAEEDQKVLEKLKQWIYNYRMFSDVQIQVVFIPNDALLQHHVALEAQEVRVQRQSTLWGRTPMGVMNEIEQSQIELAKLLIEREREEMERLSSSGVCRQRSNTFKDGEIINKKMREHSGSADLIITALPGKFQDQDPTEYLTFCESMTAGLPRIILIRGTENSVVTDIT